jgi:hypothetical protein
MTWADDNESHHGVVNADVDQPLADAWSDSQGAADFAAGQSMCPSDTCPTPRARSGMKLPEGKAVVELILL